jgi:uncharacterized protein with PIN domain
MTRTRKKAEEAKEPVEIQDMLFWVCEGPESHRFTGFIARGQMAPAKRCQVCNAPLELAKRGPA